LAGEAGASRWRSHWSRSSLTSSDLPALIPTLTDAANLAGRVYEVQRNRATASYPEILSAPAEEVYPSSGG